jgi:hypothetical protein
MHPSHMIETYTPLFHLGKAALINVKLNEKTRGNDPIFGECISI